LSRPSAPQDKLHSKKQNKTKQNKTKQNKTKQNKKAGPSLTALRDDINRQSIETPQFKKTAEYATRSIETSQAGLCAAGQNHSSEFKDGEGR